MEKLKVYLDKQHRNDNTTMDKIKQKIINNHQHLPHQSSYHYNTSYASQHLYSRHQTKTALSDYSNPVENKKKKEKIDTVKKRSNSHFHSQQKNKFKNKKNRSYSNSQAQHMKTQSDILPHTQGNSHRRYYPVTEEKCIKNSQNSHNGNSSQLKLINEAKKNLKLKPKDKEKSKSYNQSKNLFQRQNTYSKIPHIASHQKIGAQKNDNQNKSYSHSVCKIIQAYKKDISNSKDPRRTTNYNMRQFEEFMKKIKPIQIIKKSQGDEILLQKYENSLTSFSKNSQIKKSKLKKIRNQKIQDSNDKNEQIIEGVVIKKRSKSAKEGKLLQEPHQMQNSQGKNMISKPKSSKNKQISMFPSSESPHMLKNHNISKSKKEEKGSSKDLKRKNDEHKPQKHSSQSKRFVQKIPNEKSLLLNSNQEIQGIKVKTNFEVMFRTRKGIQIHNPNKVNQDRYIVKQQCKINPIKTIDIFAVADGHGPLGHYVSHVIAENLGKKIQNYVSMGKTISQSLHKSFSDLQGIFQKNKDFNAEYSGSTLVSIVIQDRKKIVCANVGDSRAIVARQINKQNWEVIRLSDDHKPNRQPQRKRILGAGGRIEKVRDEEGNPIGPWRVWLPRKQLQGLAMSRSLGDNISKPIGVTHEPQILTHQLDKKDKFILLASDGVWQFLTNYQILTLLIPFYRQGKLEQACDALLKAAYESWTVDDNSVVDDITFILIFLSHHEEPECKQKTSVGQNPHISSANTFHQQEWEEVSKNDGLKQEQQVHELGENCCRE